MADLNKPIIFLDMDGVLNNDYAFDVSRQGIFPLGNISAMTVSQMCVNLFEKLVKETNSDIVISSSWRSNKIDDLDFEFKPSKGRFTQGNKSVINALQWAGFIDCKDFIIGNTGRFADDPIRGIEIQRWLDTHPNRFQQGITPFVIIDDDADMTEEQLLNHFVQTNPEKGFQLNDFEKAMKILKG
jgi:hypothetical protein